MRTGPRNASNAAEQPNIFQLDSGTWLNQKTRLKEPVDSEDYDDQGPMPCLGPVLLSGIVFWSLVIAWIF